MRRLSIAFGMMILTFPLISVFAIAQTSPEIGVWKLNLAKSKFYNSQPPKNETRIVEPDGDGVKVHMEGVAGDGGPIDFTYSYKYSDGKDSSATGNVVVKRVSAHTFLGTTKRELPNRDWKTRRTSTAARDQAFDHVIDNVKA